jgi:UDP-2,3-diacylglucosamine pyrophosphatase LpxH
MVHQFLAVDFVNSRPFASSVLLKLGLELSSDLPLAGLSDVAAWFSAKFGRHSTSFYPYALHEPSFTEGWAKFIVYGHTHQYELVPLQSIQREEGPVNQIYINSGTWRPVHELAQFHPGQKHFVGYHVMTYLAFFKNNERKGRTFESWSGALDSSAD